jgi:hypothetical protein
LGLVLLSLIPFWVGINSLVECAHNLAVWHRASSFVEVNATVQKSEVKTVRSRVEHYSIPEISYSYTVDGTAHIAETHNYFWNTMSEEEAADIVEANPVGFEGVVYYDPEDPATAVVTRDLPVSRTVKWVIISIMLMLVGVTLTTYSAYQGMAAFRRRPATSDARALSRDSTR